jgi:hypothetical protein
MPYTEPVVTYTGDGVEDTFIVPFPYIVSTDLLVYVDGVAATFEVTSDTEITLDDVPGNGTEITIRRETDIDDAVVTFTDPGALLADNLNDAINQVRYAVQEAHTRIDTAVLSGDGSGADVPTPSAADRMLVSVVDGASFAWASKTVAQVQTLLGIGSIVPTPVAGSKFIVTDASTATYELKTVSEVIELLGISSDELPDPTGLPNQIVVSNSGGTGFTLYTAASLRGLLGLGTAATKNVGTSVGNVVEVISGGSYGAALPALYGGNLTGIARALDYVQWARNAGAAGDEYIASSWADVSSSAGLTKIISETAASAWSRLTGSNVLQLDAGTYHIKAIVTWHPYNGGAAADAGAYGAALRVHLINGTVNTNDFEGPIGTTYNTTDSTPFKLCNTEVEGVFKVTAGSTVDVQIQAQRYAGTDYESGASTHTLGPASTVCVRIHVWKLA